MKFGIDRPDKLLQQWKQPVPAWTLSILWICLISFLAFVWNLGSIGLVDETEPLFAEAARQMTETGDWITPYFNGATRFDKPPLIYWLMAIAYQIIGVNEWAVRLPSALAAIALTLMGFYTLKQFGFPSPAAADTGTFPALNQTDGQRWIAAWTGAAMIALNTHTIVWARTGVSDMLLSGCMGTALLAFFCGYAQPSRPQVQTRWYLAFYVLAALAVLAKGPVGIVLPVLIIGTFLLYVGNGWTVLREMRLLRGSLIFLAIAVPWFVLVIQANGQEYIDNFFGYHNFERFTQVVNRHDAPWYFYFFAVLLGFAPWSLYLPVAIARLRIWQRTHWQQQPRAAHLSLFAWSWLVVIFSFFTVAVTKLPSYVLPLMPAAAILVALLWSEQMSRQRIGRSVLTTGIVNAVFLAVLAGAVLYSPNWMGDDPAMRNLPEVISQSGILLWGAAVWAIAAIAMLILLLRRQGRWLWLVNFIGFCAFITFAVMPAFSIVDSLRQLPLRQLSATMVQAQQPQERLMMLGFQKPSLVFYTERPILFVADPDELEDQLDQIYQQNTPSVLMVAFPHKLREADLEPEQYQLVEQAGAYLLIRIELPLK
ncbi:MAG: glycosyltransferase family 39 protein [Leptolyngbyaceae cyanobacterium RM2_2_4]|nr:glycosyltransferase family 39 protein [Leptolyngbyaceae cyanobacterium RM2_2_4]